MFSINVTSLYLENVSKDFLVDNLKNSGLYGDVCDFSVDFDAIAVIDILLSTNCRLWCYWCYWQNIEQKIWYMSER